MTRLSGLAGFLAFPLLAQQPSQPPPSPRQIEPAPIKVQVNEVIVPITITDEKGRFVSDLEKEDFKIFDEGREQQRITHFSRERNQPVVVGFLLDTSNANRTHWKTFREAAIDLVDTLMPGDKRFSGYLITYGNEAELAVNTNHDPEKMMEKIRKLKPGGGSALFDAVYMACTSRDLVQGEPIEPRRIIVIIGDGHDTASKKGLSEVLELAQRNHVTVYGISTAAFNFQAEGDDNLVKLAVETGGRVEYPLNNLYKDISGHLSTPSDEGNYALKVGTGGYASEISKGIFNSIAALVGEVTTQYILRYIPSDTDSSKIYRTIVVQVPLRNVRVRAKRGYYPFAP
jgi:VWFA-related protein